VGAASVARGGAGKEAWAARAASPAQGKTPLPGMLLHIDGGKHRWFSDERWYDLLVILDDATSEIYYAQVVEEESTRRVLTALREVVERKGLFCALYSDRGSHFFWTPKAGEKVDKQRLTQVGRAMKELGMQMIPAYSPQARGRCERNFGTWQGRLPQELRLAGIGSMQEANQFLRERYIAEFNAKFAVPAKEHGSAFRKASRSDLDFIFSIQTERVVAQDHTIGFRDQVWQLEKTRWRYSLAGCTVTVHEPLDGRISVRYGPHLVANWGKEDAAGTPKQRRGKGGSLEAGENQKQVSSGFHPPLEISPTPRDSHFPTAPTTSVRSSVNKTGQVDLLTTALTIRRKRRKSARNMVVPRERVLICQRPDQPRSRREHAQETSKHPLIAAFARWRITVEIHQTKPRERHPDRIAAGHCPKQFIEHRHRKEGQHPKRQHMLVER
jgi:hypothetical protein